MPFKLARCSYAVGLSGLLVAQAAGATMIVTSKSGGSTVYPVTSGIPVAQYYDSTTSFASATDNYFFDQTDPAFGRAYSTIDRSVTGASEAALGRPNMLIFEVKTDKPISTYTNLAIQILTDTGQVQKYVPITTANGFDCPSGCSDVAGGVAYAAPFTNGMQVGIYMKDICTDYAALPAPPVNADASGCTSNSPRVFDASGRIVVQLRFSLYTTDATLAGPRVTTPNTAVGATTEIDSRSFNLNFQNAPFTYACPTNTGALYYPGDQEISVYTDKFGLTTTNASFAPASVLVVVAKEGGSPTTTSAWDSASNPVRARLGFGAPQTLGGFVNSTTISPALDHPYSVAFMIRDAAGLIAYPVAGCQLNNVATADIKGFLKKGNCFIATAAFRSIDAAPVQMLREFRDHVLLKGALGRKFVNWYYRWSPPAAEWLMEHPEFRFPVLIALIPLQVLAWLSLHTFFLGILAFLFLSVLSYTFYLKERA